MGRRITLYEAALAEAEATGGVTARQAAIAAFEKADSMVRLIHWLRKYGGPTFGFLGLRVVVVQVRNPNGELVIVVQNEDSTPQSGADGGQAPAHAANASGFVQHDRGSRSTARVEPQAH